MSKKALATGITRQNGSYLMELLLSKGYKVHGLIRRASTFSTSRIDHLYTDPHQADTKLFLHYGDMASSEQLSNLIYNMKPDGQPKRMLDTSRAKSEFGFEAKTNMRDGLKMTIDWYRNNKGNLQSA